ncbi:YqgQ family protein [bacterium LRH843]|nr:YqgQ family protein [bacterium LRH843]
MKTMYDVRQLLKRYGTIIYTRDREFDLSLMEEEFRELHKWKMIEDNTFRQGLLIIRNEMRK